jgi:hypothetical protein
LNANEEHRVTEKAGKVHASAGGGPLMSPNATKEEKEDNVTEPTTPTSSPPQSEEKKSRSMGSGEKEMKHKKSSKTHKERKGHKLLRESPPQEIDVSGNVLVASSGKTGKIRASYTDGPCMSPNVTKEEKEDHEMEPTAPSSLPPQSKEKSRKARGDEKETKHKKAASKTYRERKDHKLPAVSPPLEIDVSDNVSIASSIEGLSQFPQPRRHSGHCIEVPDRLQHPTSSHLYVSKLKSPLEVDISQPMSVASSLGYGSVVQHNKIRASASRPGRDGLIPPPWENYHRSRNKSPLKIDIVVPAKVPIESIFRTPREIDLSDPTIVSVLGASFYEH